MEWPFRRLNKYGVDTTSITPTASATPHVKGVWAEILTSTPAGIVGMFFKPNSTGASAVITNTLCDFGIGGSGSEVVIVPDYAVGGMGLGSNIDGLFIPIRIPEGVRLSVRIQGAVVSETMPNDFSFDLLGDETYSVIDALTLDTANSRGTLIAQDNTTWTELVASTAVDYDALFMRPDLYSDTTATAATNKYIIGVGTAGNEVEICRFVWKVSASERHSPFHVADARPRPVRVPAGSRLTVKRADAYANDEGACLYGFRK